MIDLSSAAFWIISVVVVGSALAVVLSNNIVHSAMFLVLSFIAVAGIYALIGVDFIAAVQILVYAGAIAILLVFGIMLTRRGGMSETNLFNRYKYLGALVSIAFAVIIVYMLSFNDFSDVAGNFEGNVINSIATDLFSDFVIPFEGAALLLLVAMIGAVMLARGGKKE
jgi:NADH:ubiquinone oxidoreductase subunit 6 (subunit J)